MKVVLLYIFCFALAVAHGQKLVSKVIANPENQYIFVDTKNCFEVTLKTWSEKKLEVKATIEGEYVKDLVVKIEEKGKDVFVSAGFLPNFINPNDKLSAHKVVSIALDISIPDNTNIQIFGTNTNIMASGNYKDLKVTLSDGHCSLKNILANAEVKTQKGNITLTTESGKILANSQYGKVGTHNIPVGTAKYSLSSVEGNIRLNKTE